MKLSEYRGEDALDVLADLVEPAIEIMGDKEFVQAYRDRKIPKAVKTAIKNHKKSVLEIMAATEREDVEEYAKKVNVFTLPAKLIELLNDKEVISLFTSQGQTDSSESFGSATENTEANAQ